MTLRRHAAALLVLLAACAPDFIPGTEAPDTADNRAIYEVIRSYVAAMQRRDAPAVLALVAPDYFDTAGTPDPTDDVDRATLERTLPADLARVAAVKLELAVKKIEVQGAQAKAEVFYDLYYRVNTPAGGVPKRPSDVHQMTFEKLASGWKISSGL